MLSRFGKSIEGLLSIKQSFFDDNDRLRDALADIAAVYRAQPPRTHCKACERALGPAAFVKAGVPYHFCPGCGHLNGGHEDTSAFCTAVYADEGGKDYARNYAAEAREAFDRRVETIYRPKAAFLADVLRNEGLRPETLAYADLGAGSGYFVAALLHAGLERTVGYEVSETQVALAEAMLGRPALRRHGLDEVEQIAATVEADVVSMIGVLEHLQRPRETLAAIRANPRVGHVYLSVPLFSFCVFLEMVFPEVMPRQLAGGHTHLYTPSSLAWTEREFGLERVGEWWFGSDLMDLYRNVAVSLHKTDEAGGMTEAWRETIVPVIDALQLGLDERRLSSEVHLVWHIRR